MKRLLTIVCLMLGLAFTVTAQAEGITNYAPLITADYWMKINNDGDKVLLNEQGIKNFNANIRGLSRTVVDLANFPATSSGMSLKTRIADYQVLEDDLYLNNKLVSDRYKNVLREQTNIGAIGENVTNRYAVVVRRTNMRYLPTGQGLFYYENDTDFDVLQETVLDPGEPVVVQHQSANGFFYFVQAYNYYGWVSRLDLAFTEKAEWLNYVNPKKFYVVTAKTLPVQLPARKETLLWQQGAKLFITKETKNTYTLDIPVRDFKTNKLIHFYKEINKKEIAPSLHKGYVPYTSNNILKAAFEHYSMPYGWGGLKNSVDCSSLVADVYRTVGIMLPRAADEQATTAGKNYPLEGMNKEAREAQIRQLMPGATLYMDGHIMLYLGKCDGEPFVLHCLGSHFVKGERQKAMRVVVSDLKLFRSNGATFRDELITCAEYK